MSWTLAEVNTMVRDRLNEATQASYKDAAIYRWMNEAGNVITRRIELLQEERIISVVADDGEYDLDPDIIRVSDAWFYEDNTSYKYPLRLIDQRRLWSVGWSLDNTHTSIPSFAAISGTQPDLVIRIFPRPNTNGSLKLLVYFYPLRITAATPTSTTLDWPDVYVDLIISYIEYQTLRADRDPRWQEAKALFEADLASVEANTRQWHDQAEMMGTAYGGGNLMWEEEC